MDTNTNIYYNYCSYIIDNLIGITLLYFTLHLFATHITNPTDFSYFC